MPRPLHRGLISIYASSASTVDDLLDLVGKGLEGEYTKEESSKISDRIDRLEEVGRGRDYLEDPRLVGYYRVQYVQDVGRGRPVGGNFRYTAAGRALFKTTDALQHILDKGVAVNMLYLKFLGSIPACVVLRGDFEQLSDAERAQVEVKFQTPPPGLSPQTIKASFDSPRISFGPSGLFTFNVGPTTTVYLDTIYLDERIRIGKNRYGGRFVFTRLGEAECLPGSPADAWRKFLAQSPGEVFLPPILHDACLTGGASQD
ncbi:hypothetical protein GUITHDRAFT_147803 [Guillardia theta CCMP2712]|uniref:Plastid lipid-associated protein/fibrillin conserved domain-containing protein n=1 Tax=Guillardia theta (strain CCMP2712) TaxID=905079 RepID=L1IBV3_GUITC|nr:hypothetical protein GUITHDRAFT_147803 [Guillardia theta CCMP2712]EKX33577.1 hypothetical protein GUITHDRAFT_147803 [Guillardia theta CCMP2712]|eukprot:XP_005820557.1 hypothetical protein GUITHDRAFT_147803 [Guillardia theta CCMP2712]